MAKQEDLFKNVISHAKEYGYIFASSEIYDGLSAVYDYGQNGAELKKNIKEYWWRSMTQLHQNIVGIDAAILMHPTTWKASGHGASAGARVDGLRHRPAARLQRLPDEENRGRGADQVLPGLW